MSDSPVVIGIAAHNGWAEFVSVAVHDGVPVVLDRRRIVLVDSDLPANPYHHEALAMELPEAEALVRRVRQDVAKRSRAALRDLQSQYSVVAVVVQKSPFDRLPDALADVLNSWHLTCAADGMMYREALVEAGSALGMKVVRYPRKIDEAQMAADRLGIEQEKVASWAREEGRRMGAPWRKEHGQAAMAAVGELGQHTEFDILLRQHPHPQLKSS
jgi:hypothetical protein